jgi:hypothetical protein
MAGTSTQGPAGPEQPASLPRSTTRPTGGLASLVTGLVVPLAVFYILALLGVSAVAASLLGGVLPGARTLYGLLRGRRLDRLAVFTSTLLVVNAGISVPAILGLVHLNPHLVLAFRQHHVLFGLWMLLSMLRGRPFVLELIRPFAERRAGAGALDARWEGDAEFRKAMRLVNTVWGAGFIADQGFDALLAFVLPVRIEPVAQSVLYVVLLLLLVGFLMSYIRWKGLAVRAAEVPV